MNDNGDNGASAFGGTAVAVPSSAITPSSVGAVVTQGGPSSGTCWVAGYLFDVTQGGADSGATVNDQGSWGFGMGSAVDLAAIGWTRGWSGMMGYDQSNWDTVDGGFSDGEQNGTYGRDFQAYCAANNIISVICAVQTAPGAAIYTQQFFKNGVAVGTGSHMSADMSDSNMMLVASIALGAFAGAAISAADAADAAAGVDVSVAADPEEIGSLSWSQGSKLISVGNSVIGMTSKPSPAPTAPPPSAPISPALGSAADTVSQVVSAVQNSALQTTPSQDISTTGASWPILLALAAGLFFLTSEG